MSERDVERVQVFLTKNLWEDESTGFACTGNARLILEKARKELGLSGKILELFADREKVEEDVSHSYVVLDTQKKIEHALNQQNGTSLKTVEEILRKGSDITEEVMNLPWDMLR